KQFDHILRDLYARLDERDLLDKEVTQFLLYANGGGVALTATFAGALIGHKAELGPALICAVGPVLAAAAIFTLGITFVGIALLGAHDAASANRFEFRRLADQFVTDGNLSYVQVFLALGKFPSKRPGYRWQCRTSFYSFIIGVIASLASVAIAASYVSG
ncbi:MAG TPA: hypothetical protein VFV07_01720, partial [Rhizomicrobium sp.]|nr:hypothetical protein [Rhizomicrobium sp.]